MTGLAQFSRAESPRWNNNLSNRTPRSNVFKSCKLLLLTGEVKSEATPESIPDKLLRSWPAKLFRAIDSPLSEEPHRTP